jgi:glycine betaine/proline transport system permease protein
MTAVGIGDMPAQARTVSPARAQSPILGRSIAYLALAAAILLCVAPTLGIPLPAGLTTIPDAYILPWRRWAGDALTYIAKDSHIGPVPVSQITRGIASVVLQPMLFLQGLVSKGLTIGGISVPPLPWLSVTLAAAALGLRFGGVRLALVTGGALLYAALFGLWDATMLTLASVTVSVAFGVLLGTLLGVLAFRHPRVDRALQPLYDVMQTVPIFAYLVPILYLFGFGPVGAMMATVIYAMPPMARVVTIALRGVPPSIGEAAAMAGCSRGQVMRLALLPSALRQMMIGVNQVLMLSLTMVIIASVIGADGLGAVVLKALQSLKIGRGLEAGVAIVLLAIALDRLSQAMASRRPRHREPSSLLARWRWPVIFAAALLVPCVLAVMVPSVARWPAELSVSTAAWWDARVAQMNLAFSDELRELKTFAFVWLLRPMKTFFLSVPWAGAVALVAALGMILGGWRLALSCGLMITFVAACGFWQPAQLSLYLIAISVLLSLLIGMPVGVACAASPRFDAWMRVVLDTIQTLPTFVYLIPVIMLLGSGNFPALIAIIIYAVTPAVRYTADALCHVPDDIVEAARMSGASRWQTFAWVKVPLARPGLLLAVNQTVMMAFGMLVITALIGTKGLEADTLISLSKADPGRGIIAGAAMAFLAIIIDRLLRAAAISRSGS